MTPTRSRTPFRFFSRLSLTQVTGVKAATLEELLEALKTVPEAVIYQHTHRFLQEHQHLAPEPANDFAVWASEALQDERAAERLAAVDTVRYATLKDLRAALVAAVEGRLKKGADGRRAPEGDELHFKSAIRYSLPTPHEAWDLAGFAEALRKVPVSSVYLHVFEARLRPPLGVNDFSLWFESELGEKSLAHAVAKLDPYSRPLEALREQIAGLVERRAAEATHA